MTINQFREYLEANGYDTSQMGLLEEIPSEDINETEEKKSSEEKENA